MRLNLRISNTDSGSTHHVVLTAEAETPVNDVARALNASQAGELFVRGSPFAGEGQLLSSGIRDGDVVEVGKPAPASEGRTGLQLVAVGGRLSGRRWVLPSRPSVVGRSEKAGLRIDDPTMSREHFRPIVDD